MANEHILNEWINEIKGVLLTACLTVIVTKSLLEADDFEEHSIILKDTG